MNSEWLKNLTPWDKVIVSGNGSTATDYITTVERITKTLIIINLHNIRHNRVTGREVNSDGWHSKYIIEPTNERVTAIRNKNHRRKLLDKFCNINCQNLSNEQLEQIIAIVDK